MHLRTEKQIMAQRPCVRNRVCASQETGCRPIDLTVSNKAAEVYPTSGKHAQKKAAFLLERALYTVMLLVALSIMQIGCGEESKHRFSLPQHPAPLPDPSDHIDMGADHREASKLLQQSD